MKKTGLFFFFVVFFLLLGCQYKKVNSVYTPSLLLSDNAVATGMSIEDALEKVSPSVETVEVNFQPKPKKMYYVIFLPNKWISREDMVQKGIDSDIAKTICEQLHYLSGTNKVRGRIIYYQEGEPLCSAGNPTVQNEIVWLKKDGTAFKLLLNAKTKKIIKIE